MWVFRRICGLLEPFAIPGDEAARRSVNDNVRDEVWDYVLSPAASCLIPHFVDLFVPNFVGPARSRYATALRAGCFVVLRVPPVLSRYEITVPLNRTIPSSFLQNRRLRCYLSWFLTHRFC